VILGDLHGIISAYWIMGRIGLGLDMGGPLISRHLDEEHLEVGILSLLVCTYLGCYLWERSTEKRMKTFFGGNCGRRLMQKIDLVRREVFRVSNIGR